MIITNFQYNLEGLIESNLKFKSAYLCQNSPAGLVLSEMECASSGNWDNWF